MSVTRRAAQVSLATLAVAAVTVTVACSGGAGKSTVRVAPTPNSEASKTGPQVLADATNALAAVPAVHVSGTYLDPATKKVVRFDGRIQADGGTESMQTSEGSAQLLFVNGHPYVKGVASFFPPAEAKKLAGRWVDIDFGSNVGGEPMSPKGVAQELSALGGGVKVEPAVTTATLNGQPVLVVRESDGGLLEVAAKGAPLPLKVVGSSSDSAGLAGLGVLTFDYSMDPVQLTAPAGAVTFALPSFAVPTNLPTDVPTASGSNSDFSSSSSTTFDPLPRGPSADDPSPSPTP